MKSRFALIFLFILTTSLVLPLAMAQFWNAYYPIMMPADLLENEWVIFTILFAIFYVTIYVSLGKVMKGNKMAPAVVAVALAFLITAGIQRQWMFLEKPIMYWALILTIILVGLTFFRAMAIGPVALTGLVLLLVGLWPFIRNSLTIGGRALLPYGLIRFLDAISPLALILLIVGFVLVCWGWLKSLSAKRQRAYFGG